MNCSITFDNINNFDERVEKLKLKPFEYNEFYYVIEYNTKIDKEKIKTVFGSVMYNCDLCVERVYNFCKIADQNGPILLQFFSDIKHINFINSVCKDDFTVTILDKSNLQNEKKISGNFPHIYFPTKFTSSIKRPEYLQLAINRYIKDGLINRLVLNLLNCNDNDASEVIRSLECFIKCCKEATYGEKFIKTANWLISIMEGYTKDNNKNIHVYTRAIIDGGIEKDLNGVVVTKYHQANENILSLLEDAKTEEAMIQLIETRLNPLNYRRRDPNAILTEGNIEHAMKYLGEFKNTIMTQEEVLLLPYCIKINSEKKYSSTDAFKQMKNEIKQRTSFASKCENKIDSIGKVYDYLDKHKNAEVLIENNNMHPLYIAKTTLDSEKIKFPHMWAFTHSLRIKQGWIKVNCILPMHKYIESHKNIAFIIDSDAVLDKSAIQNCCFPEFLTTAYARTCDKAFERINKITKITIPEGNLGIGIGTSISHGKLVKSIKIKIDGTILEITNA